MAKTKSKPRKKIPPAVEAQVLTESRRRCCLCFHLNGKSNENLQGQIAHIDHDRSNCQESNLAYLCMPHHDTYDSKTRQSKGLTPAELTFAKQALCEFLAHEATAIQADLTLTINRNCDTYTTGEQEQLLRVISDLAGVKGGIRVVRKQKGSIRLTVQANIDDAARLCRAFNEHRFPDEVAGIELALPPSRSLIIESMFDEKKAGVSKSEAMEVVRSPDAAVFLIGEQEVPYEAARVGIYTKRFGKRADLNTVIAITSIDDYRDNHLYTALRAYHRIVHVPDPPNPVQMLRAFLDVFGVDITLPGVGTSRLFLGGRMTLPPRVFTEAEAHGYLLQFVNSQWREPFSMISNTKLSDFGPFLNIYLLAFYAQRRYWKSLRR